jgi:hypothetical protein
MTYQGLLTEVLVKMARDLCKRLFGLGHFGVGAELSMGLTLEHLPIGPPTGAAQFAVGVHRVEHEQVALT